MKKICLTIVTIAALSSAAYANDRVDRRDSDTCWGKYCENAKKSSPPFTMTVVSPLAVDEKGSGLTNFERMKKISEENDHGRH
jgi:opacity protein-like surface antigen